VGQFFKKYRDFLVYIVFGAMATGVNTFGFWLFYEKLYILQSISISFDISNIVSTILAWIITIFFAFFTNKLFVYRSKSWKLRIVIKEIIEFVLCRAFSELFDIAFMYLTVSILNLHSVLMKFIAALLVGLINYFGGKLVIFRKKVDTVEQS